MWISRTALQDIGRSNAAVGLTFPPLTLGSTYQQAQIRTCIVLLYLSFISVGYHLTLVRITDAGISLLITSYVTFLAKSASIGTLFIRPPYRLRSRCYNG